MYNKAILVGRLTADPELRTTPGGTAVTSFSLAVDRAYADKDGNRQTDFINCVAWRNTAGFITKYFAKGRLIGVEGSIQTRSYDDKQGNRRTAVEVIVDNAFFTESKAAAQKAQEQKDAPQAPPPQEQQTPPSPEGFTELDGDDDLPF